MVAPRRGLLRWVRHGGALAVVAALVLSGCVSTIAGHGQQASAPVAPDVPAARFPIKGDGRTSFDQSVRNSLFDIEEFWAQAYPSVSGGAKLRPLSGGVWSIITGHPDRKEECMARLATAANNNAFYCRLDDAFVYDRTGLVNVLARQLGRDFVPLVFAHEFGHLIQERLGIDRASILLESQADCASGAFMAAEAGASPIKLKTRHFAVNPTNLDAVAVGMILLRDYTPHSAQDQGTHGNGFDRLSAFSDGFTNGVKFCYSPDWARRLVTERSYGSTTDELQGGNETLAQVLNPGTAAQGGGGLQPDLNRFWVAAFTRLNKTFTPVQVKEADHPPCSRDPVVRFAYCASDNTVYYQRALAASVYNSVPVLAQASSGQVTVRPNSPGDFALGALFAYGWGMAVRSQLKLSIDGTAALIGASCYVGAYASDINNPNKTGFSLSPQDMDEASITVLKNAALPSTFGARNTSGFERIASFKKGYLGTLTAC